MTHELELAGSLIIPHLYHGFELSGDDAECSVSATFQLVQPGWGQPGFSTRGSVVEKH